MREMSKFLRRKLLARPWFHPCTAPQATKSNTDLQLLVVSHEATRTGAPKIILQLLNRFSTSPSTQCVTILHNGGPLSTEFQRHSDVYCLDVKRKSTYYLQRMVDRIVARLRGDVPIAALVNSAESRFIAEALDKHSIPIVSLIHEFPNSYSQEDFELIGKVSQSIIFPADIVRKKAIEFGGIQPEQSRVIPQGLLDSDFGKNSDRHDCRQRIRKELGIAPDARMVLGCGTLDLRKGIDFFANTAMSFLRQHGDALETHFVWLGDGFRQMHTPFHYLMIDVKNSGIGANIHFVGERKYVEPYFNAADATLMVSREDPFPCVVHESMACGTPVIAFENAGGAPEAIAAGAGIVVAYGDCDAAAERLHRLFTTPEYHREIADRAKQRISTHYDFAKYFDSIDGIVRQTAGAAARQIVRTAA